MKTIALTGSIGMGKSTVAAMFKARGIPVFDADAVVRELQGPGGELVAAIESRFPGTTQHGQVDRERLALRVLSDRDELAALEMLVHPVVAERRAAFIAAHANAPALLFDIPLLFETGGETAFDYVIVVSAPVDIQRRRVLARPGMNQEKLSGILARQIPDATKREKADFIIDTGTSLEETEAEVDRIIACLSLRSAQ